MEEVPQQLGPPPQMPDSLLNLLPAVQAFREDLVVQGHLGDPVGEKTKIRGGRELPATWTAVVSGGKVATGGKTKETSHTHLRARLRGAAHPQSRSTLGGSGGRKRRGEVIGNVDTKHRAAREGGWLGHKAWQGLLPPGTR